MLGPAGTVTESPQWLVDLPEQKESVNICAPDGAHIYFKLQ